MINKGKIIFVNGHWNSSVIGSLIGSSKPNKQYWNQGDFNGYAHAAMRFFGLDENVNEACICLDGSSLVVLDENGSGRAERAYNDYTTYEWAGKLYRRISEKYGYNLPETAPLRNKMLAAEINKKRLARLSLGMDKTRHAFYIVGHSEGCAYAASLAKLLLEKGWKVSFIVYLSSYDSRDFDSPKGVKAYQLGYTGKYFGDWATNNNRIQSGVERFGIVYKEYGSMWDNFIRMHGSTKGDRVWIHLADLRTLMIRTGKTYGQNWQEQIAASTPNHTVFVEYNNYKLNAKEYMDGENAKFNQYNFKTNHYYKY